MNGKSPIIATALPFVLRLSKDEPRVFQQNRLLCKTPIAPIALKGDLKGFWSVSVSGNWRVVFRFEKGDAFDVDLIDYH